MNVEAMVITPVKDSTGDSRMRPATNKPLETTPKMQAMAQRSFAVDGSSGEDAVRVVAAAVIEVIQRS